MERPFSDPPVAGVHSSPITSESLTGGQALAPHEGAPVAPTATPGQPAPIGTAGSSVPASYSTPARERRVEAGRDPRAEPRVTVSPATAFKAGFFAMFGAFAAAAILGVLAVMVLVVVLVAGWLLS